MARLLNHRLQSALDVAHKHSLLISLATIKHAHTHTHERTVDAFALLSASLRIITGLTGLKSFPLTFPIHPPSYPSPFCQLSGSVVLLPSKKMAAKEFEQFIHRDWKADAGSLETWRAQVDCIEM